MTPHSDTIYALSTGSLPSGVAVVRISGDKAKAAISSFGCCIPEPRVATVRTLRDEHQATLDQALLLFFPAPNSFTGEDVAELQLHGGRAVVQSVLKHLASVEGLRAAEAGEFTRRAFENSRLDLVEVEGLSDLLAAETKMQQSLAMSQARGGQSDLYKDWMTQITRCRALIEAELDFPEEEDIPGSISDRVWDSVKEIALDIGNHLDGQKRAEIIRDGFNIVIAGRPNAGKSSLFNALAKRDVAIVTERPGTTRDVLEIHLDLNGYLVRLMDTAGIRRTDDSVEAEGIARAVGAARSANLVLNLREATDNEAFVDVDSDADQLYIATKCDSQIPVEGVDHSLSVKTGWGLDDLLDLIGLKISSGGADVLQMLPARQRHVSLLSDALKQLNEASVAFEFPLEIRAEKLRQAAHSLGRITGFIDADDLLGVIFAEFCIGK